MPTHGFSDSASSGFVRLEQNAYVSVRHKATGSGASGGAKGAASMHPNRTYYILLLLFAFPWRTGT